MFMTIQQLIEQSNNNWDNVLALAHIGIELEARSRFPEARKVLERAISLSPVNFPNLYVSLAFSHFRDIHSTDEKGELSIVQGLEQTDSDFLKAWYIAFIEDQQGKEYLIEYLNSLNDPIIMITLGHALLWQGEHDKGWEISKHGYAALGPDIIDNIPDELDLYCSTLIWLHGSIPEVKADIQSIPLLNLLQSKYPERYSYYAAEITALQVAQRWNDIIEACKKTLHIFPDEETTMLAMALAFEKLEKYQSALLWLNRAIGVKYTFSRARLVAARILKKIGEHELAQQVILEIPIANPRYSIGKVHVAIFLYENDNISLALDYFRSGYSDLKPHEKAQIDQNPIVKKLLEEQKKSILLNILQ